MTEIDAWIDTAESTVVRMASQDDQDAYDAEKDEVYQWLDFHNNMDFHYEKSPEERKTFYDRPLVCRLCSGTFPQGSCFQYSDIHVNFSPATFNQVQLPSASSSAPGSSTVNSPLATVDPCDSKVRFTGAAQLSMIMSAGGSQRYDPNVNTSICFGSPQVAGQHTAIVHMFDVCHPCVRTMRANRFQILADHLLQRAATFQMPFFSKFFAPTVARPLESVAPPTSTHLMCTLGGSAQIDEVIMPSLKRRKLASSAASAEDKDRVGASEERWTQLETAPASVRALTDHALFHIPDLERIILEYANAFAGYIIIHDMT